MVRIKPLPSVEYLRECFEYSPETGALIWKERPRAHFALDVGWRIFNAKFAGREAGYLSSKGHFDLGLTVGGVHLRFLSHRVALAMSTGSEPPDEVDHINGNPRDNRLENLRVGTHAENGQNLKLAKNNTSGYMGVWFHKLRRKWAATIHAGGRKYHLGLFPTPELAHEAYLGAKRRLHTFNPVPRQASSGIVRAA